MLAIALERSVSASIVLKPSTLPGLKLSTALLSDHVVEI